MVSAIISFLIVGNCLTCGTSIGLQHAIKPSATGPAESSSLQILRVPLRLAEARHGLSRRSMSLLQVSTGRSLRQGMSVPLKDMIASVPTHAPPPMQLYGSVYVGTPGQEFQVLFDTGSGNLVIPDVRCNSNACRAHRAYDKSLSVSVEAVDPVDKTAPPLPETVHLSFGGGTVDGGLVQDKVCLGSRMELCAPTGIVEARQMSDTPFGLFAYDGILGLSLPGQALEKRFNLMGNLAVEGFMESNRFAVWLATEHDKEESEITFGAASDTRIASGEVMWFPVLKPLDGCWKALMQDVTVGHARLHLCGEKGCEAAFDTGTGVIAGPTPLIEALLSVLDIKLDCSNYDSLPTFGFAFKGVTMSIDKGDYIKRERGNCYHQLLPLDLPPPSGPLVLLGMPFLRRYYTVYDRQYLQIGIAFARHKMSEGSSETSEQAAARLMVRPTDADESAGGSIGEAIADGLSALTGSSDAEPTAGPHARHGKGASFLALMKGPASTSDSPWKNWVSWKSTASMTGMSAQSAVPSSRLPSVESPTAKLSATADSQPTLSTPPKQEDDADDDNTESSSSRSSADKTNACIAMMFFSLLYCVSTFVAHTMRELNYNWFQSFAIEFTFLGILVIAWHIYGVDALLHEFLSGGYNAVGGWCFSFFWAQFLICCCSFVYIARAIAATWREGSKQSQKEAQLRMDPFVDQPEQHQHIPHYQAGNPQYAVGAAPLGSADSTIRTMPDLHPVSNPAAGSYPTNPTAHSLPPTGITAPAEDGSLAGRPVAVNLAAIDATLDSITQTLEAVDASALPRR